MKLFIAFLFSFVLTINLLWARTLIISDSHSVGAFGEKLVELLEDDGHDVSIYAFGGTRPTDWVQGNNLTWGYWEHHTGQLNRRGDNRATPRLNDLIEKHRPNRVIIVQGTNMVWRPITSLDREHVQLLMQSSLDAGAECIWVGPPDLNVPPQNEEGVRAIQLMLGEEAMKTGCSYIKSWTFTDYPQNQGDGVHYDAIPKIGQRLARDWALGVHSKLKKP